MNLSSDVRTLSENLFHAAYLPSLSSSFIFPPSLASAQASLAQRLRLLNTDWVHAGAPEPLTGLANLEEVFSSATTVVMVLARKNTVEEALSHQWDPEKSPWLACAVGWGNEGLAPAEGCVEGLLRACSRVSRTPQVPRRIYGKQY